MRLIPKWIRICITILLVFAVAFSATMCLPSSAITWSDIFGAVGVKNTLPDGSYIYYLDVGQGDCEVIVSNGKTVLIDCGDKSKGDDIADFLHRIGCETVDYVFISHPHEDHCGGIYALADYINIKNVVVSSWTPSGEDDSGCLTAMRRDLFARGITFWSPVKGDICTFGAFKLTVIYCDDWAEEENDRSAIYRAECGNNKFLFMGDASDLVENELIYENVDLSCDILKAGHHGSASSTSDEFLEAVKPKTVVFSCGLGNSYGHPSKDAVGRVESHSIKYYRTDVNGTIKVNAETLAITSEH